jgi:hypothetical protein
MMGIGRQVLELGGQVARRAVRGIATRIAARIRDRVDLSAQPPTRPPPPPRPSNLVVTPPEGGVGTRASHPRPAPAPVAHVFQLFERIRLVQPDGEVPGEIYEVHEGLPPRFDVLIYSDEGRPQLITALGAGALLPLAP